MKEHNRTSRIWRCADWGRQPEEWIQQTSRKRQTDYTESGGKKSFQLQTKWRNIPHDNIDDHRCQKIKSLYVVW
jgi:hypothetical protein